MGFPGVILLKKMEIRMVIPRKCNYSVFPCVGLRQRVQFPNFCHDYLIEDCSEIRNNA